MDKSEPKKRVLQFANFDEMLADVRSLEAGGYISNGQWTLGQACGHVADWARFPMDGFPKPPFFMRLIFGVMRYTVAPGMMRKILAEGFKAGMPTAPETVPDADSLSDHEGIEQLVAVTERLASHSGDLLPSPLFGPMDKEKLTKVTLLHAQHHFGYLEPK